MKKSRKKKQRVKSKEEPRRSISSFDLEPPQRYFFNDEVISSFNVSNESPKANEKPRNRNEIRRRQNKKRKLKREVRNFIITASIIIGVAVLGTILSLTMFFNIEKINISGSGTYSETEIEALCNINIGDNMFLIDKDKCREKLTSNLPYIYDITIKRKLPNTINIDITEAEPAYVIKNDDKTYTLLDDNLKVLENASKEKHPEAITIKKAIPVSNEPGYIIEFENEDTLNCIKSIVAAIKEVELSDVSVISSADKNNNSILYKNRITFELGDCKNLENKIYKALAACEELDKRNDKIKGKLNVSSGKEIYFTES